METTDIVVQELEEEPLEAGEMTRPGCLSSEGLDSSS